MPAFYRECRRVLRPHGALAVFSYIPLEIRFEGCPRATEALQCALLASNEHFHPCRQRFVLRLFDGAMCGCRLHCSAAAWLSAHLPVRRLPACSGWGSATAQPTCGCLAC